MSETERDSDWSEQYAETGGWPPPAEGQRRYGPGTTPSPAADPGQWGQPTNPAETGGYGQPYGPAAPSGPAAGYDQAGQTGGPGQWGPADQANPAGGYAQTGPADTGGHAQTGQWRPADQGSPTGGYAQTGPADTGQTGQWGPADQRSPTGGYGQPGPAGYGQAGPADAGGYAQPSGYGQAGQWGQADPQWAQGNARAAPWAPGDPAYGRLEPGAPARPQRPRRPWDGRPAPARRPTPVRRPTGTPVVTYTLIGICVVVYLLQQANPSFTTRYGLIPYAVEQGQYARLITSAFLHAGLLHLVTNMITLFIVGTPLERVLRPARFLLVYVLSALGGSLLSVWLSPQFSVGVGASGAIFGLFGALVVLRRQVGAEAGGLAVLIGLNLVISFTVPNISWQAHIGGLVTGVLVALALRGVDRLSRRPAT